MILVFLQDESVIFKDFVYLAVPELMKKDTNWRPSVGQKSGFWLYGTPPSSIILRKNQDVTLKHIPAWKCS
jgi:hypothetical protein